MIAEAFDLTTINSLTDVPSSFAEMLVSIRRHLHRHPEVGFEEEQTSAYIAETLTEHGLDVHGPLARTGRFVDIVGDHPGGCVAYRADIDALPIVDAKVTDYASQNHGVAHLCGHDAHTTVGIGVALLASQLRDHIHGTIRVFFQPNEEGMPSGAPEMIKAGVLDGVDAAYAIHVDPTLSVGQYGLRIGAATAAADRFRVVVRNPTTGHSARPHESTDTIWIATQIANTLYQLAGRVTDARSPAVLTICRFRAGEAYNVIPSEAEFGGTLRCTGSRTRRDLLQRIEDVAQHFGNLYGDRVRVLFDHGAPPVVNDEAIIKNVRAVIKEQAGEDAIVRIRKPSMGAEDFAHYLQHIPGALIRVGTASGPTTCFPLHDASFDIDEAALLPTVQVMTGALLRHLRNQV